MRSSDATSAAKSRASNRVCVSNTEMSACPSMYASSGTGEKVDNGTAIAPAIGAPKIAATASGRLPMSTPTRAPLPTPAAISALATRRAWCRRSA